MTEIDLTRKEGNAGKKERKKPGSHVTHKAGGRTQVQESSS